MAAKSPPLKGGSLSDFSGGPNLRDDAAKLAANESLDAYNCTFDERGDVTSRLGYAKYNSAVFDAAVLHKNLYWSSLLATTVAQVGTKLYKGTSTVSVKTFSTSATVTFAELNSLVVAAHPIDGLFTSADGVTWTAVADPDAPTTPTCCATWQNKLFTGKSDGKLSWSAAGDATNWSATDFNKIWEKDQAGIVALHIGSGQDILGRPGLLVFKQESTYRVYDSTTGAYTTVDATVGAAGPLAVVGVGSKVLTISKRGISWWREDQLGMVDASDRFFPLWRDQTNLAQQALWCAGRKSNNRAVFSLTRAGSSANDLALEYHTEQNWIAPRSDAMACYTTSTGTTGLLYGGSPSVNGQAWQLESGGSDNGTAITGWFQTRWIQTNNGFQSSVWQVRIHGRGSGTLTIRTDFQSGGGSAQPFDLTGTTLQYDTDLQYDSGLSYSEPVYQNTEAFYSIGLCRQFSLRFDFSATSTFTAPQVLGSGTNPQLGYFGLSGLEYLYVPLGLS